MEEVSKQLCGHILRCNSTAALPVPPNRIFSRTRNGQAPFFTSGYPPGGWVLWHEAPKIAWEMPFNGPFFWSPSPGGGPAPGWVVGWGGGTPGWS